jgi:hypothetical protein
MDSQLRFTEENSMIQISIDVDRYLTAKYDDIKWDILDVVNDVEYPGEEYVIDQQAFVVKTEIGDYFFVADIVFESPIEVLVVDIIEVDIDTFLDYINLNKYIKYGV